MASIQVKSINLGVQTLFAFSLMISVLETLTPSPTPSGLNIGPFSLVGTISSSIYTDGVYNHQTYYDDKRDQIWLFRGRSITYYPNSSDWVSSISYSKVSVYDYNTESFSEKTLMLGPSNTNTNHVRVIDDMAYAYVGSGQIIWRYNLTSGSTSDNEHYQAVNELLRQNIFRLENIHVSGVLAADTENKLLFIILGTPTLGMWGYLDIKNDNQFIDATNPHPIDASMDFRNEMHTYPAEYYNGKLCLFSPLQNIGDSFIKPRCTNTSDLPNSNWYYAKQEILAREHTFSLLINEYVILIGGENRKARDYNKKDYSLDIIQSFNMITEKVYNYTITLPQRGSFISPVYIPKIKTMYIIGCGAITSKWSHIEPNISMNIYKTSISNLGTNAPSKSPTYNPTNNPTTQTMVPSLNPSFAPTVHTKYPTFVPSINPTNLPSTEPTRAPSNVPSLNPTYGPTYTPSYDPSEQPSMNPTANSLLPSENPTQVPTMNPTSLSNEPTKIPSVMPTKVRTIEPTQEEDIDHDNNDTEKKNKKSKTLPIYLYVVIGICIFIVVIVASVAMLRYFEKNENETKNFDNTKNTRIEETALKSTIEFQSVENVCE